MQEGSGDMYGDGRYPNILGASATAQLNGHGWGHGGRAHYGGVAAEFYGVNGSRFEQILLNSQALATDQTWIMLATPKTVTGQDVAVDGANRQLRLETYNGGWQGAIGNGASWNLNHFANAGTPSPGRTALVAVTNSPSDNARLHVFDDTGYYTADSTNSHVSDETAQLYVGNVRTGNGFGYDGFVHALWWFSAILDPVRIRALWEDPWAPLNNRIMVPLSTEIGAIPLNIDALTHAHPVDEVALSANYTLVVDALTHAQPVDQADVTEIGAAETLDIDALTHAQPVDQVNVTADYLLSIDALTHAQPVDAPVLTVPPNTLSIDALTHVHPVDAPLLVADYPLSVDPLSHAHPVDQVAMTALEGARTALVGETLSWDADAGAVLSNTNGADTTNWHVVEIVFDGANSIIAVDGVEVTGDAGIRALSALTVGAESDGDNRLQGTLGELRIYAGEVTPTLRSQIRAELQQKWITG